MSEEEVLKKIGDKLKHIRKKAGYTSYENFAFDNDIPRIQYWRMEKGKNITIKSLCKILDIHKMKLSEFFSDI